MDDLVPVRTEKGEGGQGKGANEAARSSCCKTRNFYSSARTALVCCPACLRSSKSWPGVGTLCCRVEEKPIDFSEVIGFIHRHQGTRQVISSVKKQLSSLDISPQSWCEGLRECFEKQSSLPRHPALVPRAGAHLMT